MRITDKEVEQAMKLAKRKTGVTRLQLAEALDISVARAALVLDRAGLDGAPVGPKAGKASRTLIFTV